jgi:hypothetical protein
MRIQIGGVAVEETKVELIRGLGVVIDGPVVTTIEPLLGDRLGQFDSLSDRG